jgi:hypothetical protein
MAETQTPTPQPEWFVIGDALLWPLVGMAASACRCNVLSNPDLSALGELAIFHHAGCLEASASINRRGKHSVAIGLVRQSVEALSIAEVALQDPAFAEPTLAAWKDGKKSQGDIRKALEQTVWSSYGKGLWSEPWQEFYANLARAVQPYAHYTPELQGWQFADRAHTGGTTFVAELGFEAYDPLKATRITLLHMLLTWMLGRILLAHGRYAPAMEKRQEVLRLGASLANSKLLFRGGNWGDQLAPHMLFKPGHTWRDDA